MEPIDIREYEGDLRVYAQRIDGGEDLFSGINKSNWKFVEEDGFARLDIPHMCSIEIWHDPRGWVCFSRIMRSDFAATLRTPDGAPLVVKG